MPERIEFSLHEEAPGVWGAVIGEKAKDNLLSIAGVEPRYSALAQMGQTEFPFEREIKAEYASGYLVLRFPLTESEQIYGLGLNFKSLNQKKSIKRLKTDHYSGRDDGRTHAPCPFYVSSKGYGVFINTISPVTVYVGTTNKKDSPNPPIARDRNRDRKWTAIPLSDYIEVVLNAKGAQIVVFGGPTIMDVVRRYNFYCGGGCLPPKWGLGIWKRVPSLYTDEQVMETVKEFTDRGLPLDVVGLEPGWHSKSYPCTYEWDKERYPDPEKFVKTLLEKNIRVNLWENPYVSPDAPIYEALLPLSGTYNVWCGIVPDYTMPEAADIYKKQHGTCHVDIGVSGYKIDECDGRDAWLWPDHAEFPSGYTGEEMRQIYGLKMQSISTEIFRERNKRTYGLVRASNSGGVSFPYVIYNDYYNFADYITALLNSGFCGVLWTPEIRDAKTAEEWVRRFQVVCFSPMAMINSWASKIEPWSYPEVADAVKDVMLLRKRFIPYLYSAFARYHFEGIPPFRAMVVDFGCFGGQNTEVQGKLDNTENPYALATSKDILDQYMMGDCLMVAPMMPEYSERKVILPPGDWYDFYTGEWVGNGQIITAKPGLERIPLYVKDGGIIPLVAEDQTGDIGTVLEVRHYGKSEGSFILYDDDGESYAYEKGEYNMTLLTVTNKNGKLVGKSQVITKGVESSYKELNFVYMTK